MNMIIGPFLTCYIVCGGLIWLGLGAEQGKKFLWALPRFLLGVIRDLTHGMFRLLSAGSRRLFRGPQQKKIPARTNSQRRRRRAP